MGEYSRTIAELQAESFDFGMTTYPIFSEAYRATLNAKILNHYKHNEIGFESPDMFKHYLNVSLDEIMPYYNKLYQSELLAINPLLSFSRTEESSTTTSATTESESETTNTRAGEVEQTTTGESATAASDKVNCLISETLTVRCMPPMPRLGKHPEPTRQPANPMKTLTVPNRKQ
jgi:hypothetical protein